MKRPNNPFTPLFWEIVGALVIILIFILLGLEAERNRKQMEKAESMPITKANFDDWQVIIIGSDRNATVKINEF